MDEATTTGIIKADARGRMRYTAQFREEALAAFERSGMSAAGFAERCGVKYQTFAGWVKRRRNERQQGGGSKAMDAGGELNKAFIEALGSNAVKTRRKVSSLGKPPGSFKRSRSHFSHIWAKRSKSSKSSIPQTIAAKAMKITSPK